MFRGRYVHTIDAKNRMSLPASFRQEHQGDDGGPPFLTQAHRCLELYRHEDWLAFESRIVEAASVNPKVQAYARMMISGAQECPIDKQGRILVPPHLREYATLDREVTVAGVGPKIELWNTARFEEILTQTQANFEDMAMFVSAKVES